MIGIFVKFDKSKRSEPAWEGRVVQMATFEDLSESDGYLKWLEKRGEQFFAQLGFVGQDAAS